MSDVISPTKKVTFTVKKSPRRIADAKTIQRLMLMQRPIQNGLRKLSKRRKRHDWYDDAAGPDPPRPDRNLAPPGPEGERHDR